MRVPRTAEGERTCDVASDDGFDGEDGGLPDPDGAPLELVPVLVDECGHVVEVAGDDMVGDVLGVGVGGEVVEEEEGQAGEELALVRDAVLHDHVKRRDAVGRDKEESVVVTGHGVDVAHLAPREQLQRRAVGLGQGRTRPARHGEVWEREQEGEETVSCIMA